MKSATQFLKDPWRLMIAVNIAIVIVLYIYKIALGDSKFQYLHLIIDYHFGFAKRSLMGTLLSFVMPSVPVWFVYVLGLAAWLIVLALFLRLFKRTFGFSQNTAPLLVFVAGSPFFFKNFLVAIGYFDIYGCLFALVMLLIPARSFLYVVIGGLGCVVLILLHHLHFLLYVPTIVVIVAIRYYFVRRISALELLGGGVISIAIAATFVIAQFYGNVPVPMDQLIAYLRTRTANPNYFLDPVTIEVWYRPIENDMRSTRFVFIQNVKRVPAYFVLIALHWPLIKYFTGLTGALASAWHRKLVVVAVVLVSIGYLIIFAVVFDYARWISGWGVCMFLIMFAVKTLPAARETNLIDAESKLNRILGWCVTIIPRVGVTRPF